MVKKVKTHIEGLQELQDWNNKAIASLKPEGNVGKAVQLGLTEAHRYVLSITHVVTGTLRASHRMQLRGVKGTISIQRGARNPKTGGMAHIYGVEEHERGGSHAFYYRTVEEEGLRIGSQMADVVVRGIS